MAPRFRASLPSCRPACVYPTSPSLLLSQTMWKIYLVNTPMLFRAVWAIVKPWLHPVTAAKVS